MNRVMVMIRHFHLFSPHSVPLCIDIVQPDFTRFHSQSGKITQMITDYYGFTRGAENKTVPKVTILPTLGTHAPMTQEQIKTMSGDDV